MTRLILHIGPLRTEDGSTGLTVYFLVPGDPEHPLAFAETLAAAEPELRQMADGDDLACEPALKAEGRLLGLGSAPLDREAREMLAAMALDIIDRAAFSRIERDELIGYFCEAAAAFEETCRQGWPRDRRHLEVRSGDEVRVAVVIDGPGLAILDGSAGSSDANGDEGPPHFADGIGAVLAPGDTAIAGALRRAFGLERVPQPFRVSRMEKLPLEDQDLALLIATLFATAALDPSRPGTASGHVDIEGISVVVTVAAV